MNRIIQKCIVLLLLAGCVGCVQNEDPTMLLPGTWQQISLIVGGQENSATSIASTFMEINANGILRYHDGATAKTTRSGWSYKEEVLNIALFMPVGYYIEKINPNSMCLRRVDFDKSELVTTLSQWRRVDSSVFPK